MIESYGAAILFYGGLLCSLIVRAMQRRRIKNDDDNKRIIAINPAFFSRNLGDGE